MIRERFVNTKRYIDICNQQGFTLIEALLALFVLTIGVLGAAGLQMQSLQSGSVAMQRMIVVMKTQEIIERMRSNNNIVDRRETDGTASSLTAYHANTGTNHNCHAGAVCSALQMADNDIYLWRADLASSLPGFIDAVIDVSPAPGLYSPVPVTITLSWVDRGTNFSYTVNVDI
jgi:type IV pilus assembly protein PilV